MATEEKPAKDGARIRDVPAVTRAVSILRLLGKTSSPLTLKVISQELGLVTSTALHILRALVAEDLVRVDVETKRYSLGVGMLTLAKSVIERNPFPTLVQPMLDQVSEDWGLTTIGVEVSGLEHMVVLALSRSHTPFSLHVDVGSRFPALISATGRLVAAYSPASPKELERKFKALRWDKAPDFEVWSAEVEAVRKKGFSIDRNNYITGVVVIAIPVLDRLGRMTHSLVAAGMAEGLSVTQGQQVAKQLQAHAASLTQFLAT